MLASSRVAASIDVLADILAHRRPAQDALKDWGLKNRYAGSKDRAAIAALVYDALRCKSSAAAQMGADSPRAIIIGCLVQKRDASLAEIEALFNGERHAPSPLSLDEKRSIASQNLSHAPESVRANCPEWLYDDLAKQFGVSAQEEVSALSTRAPFDIRVNALKHDRAEVVQELSHLKHEETPISNYGLRFFQNDYGQAPALESEGIFRLGGYEIQDEGSQIVSLLTGAKAGDMVIDLCAGAGGKSLALAAMMGNQGAIHATDIDRRRLASLYERKERSGASIIAIHPPFSSTDEPLEPFLGKADLAVIDAPCTGTGVWRRNPDAKWRMRPNALAARQRDQDKVLARGAGFVKSGGRMAYITCSLLPAENDERIEHFLGQHSDFTVLPADQIVQQAKHLNLAGRYHKTQHGLLLTPHKTGTDGFYFCMMQRQ